VDRGSRYFQSPYARCFKVKHALGAAATNGLWFTELGIDETFPFKSI